MKKKAENAKRTGQKNYKIYRLSSIEKILLTAVSVTVSGGIGYLFFNSIYMIPVLLIPVCIVLVRFYKNLRISRTIKKLSAEFEELSDSLAESLQAGYSLENAFFEARKQLRIIHEKADILDELDYICGGISMNQPVEMLVGNMAKRTGIEDIITFSELLVTARKSGGNLIAVIRQNASILHDKRQVLEDIETVITAKKLENRVMNLMPAGILIYLKLSSPEFMDVLYTTLMGRLVMAGCLIVYVVAIYIGRRITDFDNIGKVRIKFKKNKKIKKSSLVKKIYSLLRKSPLKERINKIDNNIKTLIPSGDPAGCIYAFWHGMILKMLYAIIALAAVSAMYVTSGDENMSYVVFALAVASILVPYSLVNGIKEDLAKRRKQLEADYPVLISRFSLLMGAGLTMKSAWEKIVNDYVKKRENSGQYYHYAYEEMKIALNRMAHGMSETGTYEEFGKRTLVHSYMKFSTMLVQNLKKGNRTLLDQLQLSSIDALYSRRESTKRLGEEASSKLLLPMMMQFIIILVVIMYPALAGLSM